MTLKTNNFDIVVQMEGERNVILCRRELYKIIAKGLIMLFATKTDAGYEFNYNPYKGVYFTCKLNTDELIKDYVF